MCKKYNSDQKRDLNDHGDRNLFNDSACIRIMVLRAVVAMVDALLSQKRHFKLFVVQAQMQVMQSTPYLKASCLCIWAMTGRKAKSTPI